MATPEDNQPIGPTSQLGENRGGLPSFNASAGFNSPSDIAMGGGSRLDDSKGDFGTLAQSRRMETNTQNLRDQMLLNRKKERAVRIGYRNMIKRGDGAGALRLLQESESQGISPFGIKMEGQRAEQASAQISGRSNFESYVSGQRPPQQGGGPQMSQGPIQSSAQSTGGVADSPVSQPSLSSDDESTRLRGLWDEINTATTSPEGDPWDVQDLSSEQKLGFRQRLGGLSGILDSPDEGDQAQLDSSFQMLGVEPAYGREVLARLNQQNAILSTGNVPKLSQFR